MCVCIYKMNTFTLFTAKTWKKNGVEPKEYGGEIRINQGHLRKKLGIANIVYRTQYYSSKYKKNEMRNTRV